MITKKINKSSQLIFISPNYLKLSDSKPINKKSLHLASPKGSTAKHTIKTIYKPLTSSKKIKQPSNTFHHQQEYNTTGNKHLGMSIHSPAPNISKVKSNNNTSKRSKSKLTVNEHLSTDLWRSSVYQSLNSKQLVQTHRRPQSIQLKWKYDEKQKLKQFQQHKDRQRQRQRERQKSRDSKLKQKLSLKKQRVTGIKSEQVNEQQYTLLVNRTKQMFKKYTNIIVKLNQEMNDLKEQNMFLKKKFNLM